MDSNQRNLNACQSFAAHISACAALVLLEKEACIAVADACLRLTRCLVDLNISRGTAFTKLCVPLQTLSDGLHDVYICVHDMAHCGPALAMITARSLRAKLTASLKAVHGGVVTILSDLQAGTPEHLSLQDVDTGLATAIATLSDDSPRLYEVANDSVTKELMHHFRNNLSETSDACMGAFMQQLKHLSRYLSCDVVEADIKALRHANDVLRAANASVLKSQKVDASQHSFIRYRNQALIHWLETNTPRVRSYRGVAPPAVPQLISFESVPPPLCCVLCSRLLHGTVMISETGASVDACCLAAWHACHADMKAKLCCPVTGKVLEEPDVAAVPNGVMDARVRAHENETRFRHQTEAGTPNKPVSARLQKIEATLAQSKDRERQQHARISQLQGQLQQAKAMADDKARTQRTQQMSAMERELRQLQLKLDEMQSAREKLIRISEQHLADLDTARLEKGTLVKQCAELKRQLEKQNASATAAVAARVLQPPVAAANHSVRSTARQSAQHGSVAASVEYGNTSQFSGSRNPRARHEWPAAAQRGGTAAHHAYSSQADPAIEVDEDEFEEIMSVIMDGHASQHVLHQHSTASMHASTSAHVPVHAAVPHAAPSVSVARDASGEHSATQVGCFGGGDISATIATTHSPERVQRDSMHGMAGGRGDSYVPYNESDGIDEMDAIEQVLNAYVPPVHSMTQHYSAQRDSTAQHAQRVDHTIAVGHVAVVYDNHSHHETWQHGSVPKHSTDNAMVHAVLSKDGPDKRSTAMSSLWQQLVAEQEQDEWASAYTRIKQDNLALLPPLEEPLDRDTITQMRHAHQWEEAAYATDDVIHNDTWHDVQGGDQTMQLDGSWQPGDVTGVGTTFGSWPVRREAGDTAPLNGGAHADESRNQPVNGASGWNIPAVGTGRGTSGRYNGFMDDGWTTEMTVAQPPPHLQPPRELILPLTAAVLQPPGPETPDENNIRTRVESWMMHDEFEQSILQPQHSEAAASSAMHCDAQPDDAIAAAIVDPEHLFGGQHTIDHGTANNHGQNQRNHRSNAPNNAAAERHIVGGNGVDDGSNASTDMVVTGLVPQTQPPAAANQPPPTAAAAPPNLAEILAGLEQRVAMTHQSQPHAQQGVSTQHDNAAHAESSSRAAQHAGQHEPERGTRTTSTAWGRGLGRSPDHASEPAQAAGQGLTEADIQQDEQLSDGVKTALCHLRRAFNMDFILKKHQQMLRRIPRAVQDEVAKVLREYDRLVRGQLARHKSAVELADELTLRLQPFVPDRHALPRKWQDMELHEITSEQLWEFLEEFVPVQAYKKFSEKDGKGRLNENTLRRLFRLCQTTSWYKPLRRMRAEAWKAFVQLDSQQILHLIAFYLEKIDPAKIEHLHPDSKEPITLFIKDVCGKMVKYADAPDLWERVTRYCTGYMN